MWSNTHKVQENFITWLMCSVSSTVHFSTVEPLSKDTWNEDTSLLSLFLHAINKDPFFCPIGVQVAVLSIRSCQFLPVAVMISLVRKTWNKWCNVMSWCTPLLLIAVPSVILLRPGWVIAPRRTRSPPSTESSRKLPSESRTNTFSYAHISETS